MKTTFDPGAANRFTGAFVIAGGAAGGAKMKVNKALAEGPTKLGNS